MTTPVELRDATPRGVAFLGAESMRAGDGSIYWVGRYSCRDGWAAAALLQNLARLDAGEPFARDAALTLRRRLGADPGVLARGIHAFVKSHVEFLREARENFQSARYTLSRGLGDCDDHARAVYALGTAAGLKVRLRFLSAPNGQPAHVVAQIYEPQWVTAPNGRRVRVGMWAWAETTIDARFGENPIAALHRIGAHDREDIGGMTMATMKAPPTLTGGETGADAEADVPSVEDTIAGLDAKLQDELTEAAQSTEGIGETNTWTIVHTRDLSDEFFTALDAMCARLGCNKIDMLAVLNRESGVSAAARNPRGAYGLNQIMGFHFEHGDYGWPSSRPAAEFLNLSAEDQLVYVERYFSAARGHLGSIGAIYGQNFLPGRVAQRGTAPGTVLTERGEAFYDQNAGLDADGDGKITIQDLTDSAKGTARGERWDEVVARAGGGSWSDGTGGGLRIAASVAGVLVAGLLSYAVVTS